MLRWLRRHWWVGLVAVFVACTYGHDKHIWDPLGLARPVVHPGESYLGGSVLMVLDSNHAPLEALESYDLDRSRVQLMLTDPSSGAMYPMLVRSVFSVESGRSNNISVPTWLPGAWVTAALADLPTDSEIDPPAGGYPADWEIVAYFDGIERHRGLVKLLGTGGATTDLDNLPGFFLPLAVSLEPRSTLRLRAANDNYEPPGFQAGWEIGALELTLRYDGFCLADPSNTDGLAPPLAVTNTGAIEAAIALGPPEAVSANPRSFSDPIQQPVLLVEPEGFTFQPQPQPGPTVGDGPFLEFAFDRTGEATCTLPLADYVEILDLKVYDRDGNTHVELEAEGGADSTAYFRIHSVDPDRPS